MQKITELFENVYLISFTNQGKKIESELSSFFLQNNVHFSIFDKSNCDLDLFLQKIFLETKKKSLVIFVSAVGICVRKIALFLQSKITDPAVICIDDCKNFVISVLSGHIGGANEATKIISDFLGSTPVITTSTDINKKFAIDVWAKSHDFNLFEIGSTREISEFIKKINSMSLKNERFISVGVGCKKGVSPEKMLLFVKKTFSDLSLPIESVKSISSIDIKKDEKAIIFLAKTLNASLFFYSANELNSIKSKNGFSKSEFVQKKVGVDCVCERSALISSKNKVILQKKISSEGMTISIAV